jgi:hypothetical protein
LIDLARCLKPWFGLQDIPLTASRSPTKNKENRFVRIYRRLIHELTTLVGTLGGSFKADNAANESEFFYSQETTMDSFRRRSRSERTFCHFMSNQQEVAQRFFFPESFVELPRVAILPEAHRNVLNRKDWISLITETQIRYMGRFSVGLTILLALNTMVASIPRGFFFRHKNSRERRQRRWLQHCKSIAVKAFPTHGAGVPDQACPAYCWFCVGCQISRPSIGRQRRILEKQIGAIGKGK